MNRKPKIYLAGTISAQEYRDYVKKHYEKFFDFIDPFVEVDHNESPQNIVSNDLHFINTCDLLIAYVQKITFGTTMEIFHAYRNNKTVYVITNEKLADDIWLKCHSTKMFFDIDNCMKEALDNFGLKFKLKEQNINDHKYERVIKRNYFEEKGEEMDKKDNMNMGEAANNGLTRDDSKTSTRLLDKQWSPLIVRKYQAFGWPLFIGMICDANLSDLDKTVYKAIDAAKAEGFVENDIQGQRNFCGFLSDWIVNHYDSVKRGCVEGIAVLAYWDKSFCSSLYGDFMVHASCKQELFSIIQTLPHI